MIKFSLWLLAGLTVFCQAYQDIPSWNYGPMSLYPADPAQRLYKLPFDSGVTHECIGGYGSDPNSGYKHPDYSVDFDLAQGEPILAVRAGVVSQTYYRNMDTVCNLPGSPGNSLAVSRVDTIVDTTMPSGKRILRTYDYYLHINLNPFVKPGDTVAQGQVVALASCTGMDGGSPHVHFKVYMPPHVGYFPSNPSYTFNSIPTPFVEITDVSNGLPELYHTYRSQNKRYVPAGVEQVIAAKQRPMTLSPNPARGFAVIRLESDQAGKADIGIYTLRGRKVNAPIQGNTISGSRHEYAVDLKDLPNGVYLCKVRTKSKAMAERLVILR